VNVIGFLNSEDVREILAQLDPPPPLEDLRRDLEGKVASVTVRAERPALHPA
jgi:hypothetical protein